MIRLLSAIAMFWLGLGASAQTVNVSSPSNHISHPSSLTSRLGYDAFFLEAMVQRQKGNSDAAFDLLQHCIKLNPQASEAYYFLAQYYQMLRNDSVARECYLKAAELEPDNPTYLETVAQSYIREQDFPKAIAVVEAKREENPLAEDVQSQAEGYATHPQNWYGLWYDGLIPLVYLANGSKIYFRNLLSSDADYVELAEMHSPKKMLQLIHQTSAYGALPRLEKRGLRDCQYRAEMEFENAIKNGKKKSLAVLATGSGKTYLACLASYRLLNYTPVRRILFLVDRNNLARQTESEFSQFDRTEGQVEMSSLYEIKRLKHDNDVKADIVISTIQKLFAVLTGQQLSEDSEDAEDERTTQDEEKEGKEIIRLDGDGSISAPSMTQCMDYLIDLANETGVQSVFSYVSAWAERSGWHFYVDRARQMQEQRYRDYKGVYCNAQMTERMLHEFAEPDTDSLDMLRTAMERLSLSARAYSRILKVARTIADLEASEKIQSHHIAEAIGYRSLDRGDWAERGI